MFHKSDIKQWSEIRKETSLSLVHRGVSLAPQGLTLFRPVMLLEAGIRERVILANSEHHRGQPWLTQSSGQTET